ncbi:hypothetical protein [Sinomicrobium sp. M5D2P17]
MVRIKLSPFTRMTGIVFYKYTPVVFFLKSLISGILGNGMASETNKNWTATALTLHRNGKSG